jgi:MFS family permease
MEAKPIQLTPRTFMKSLNIIYWAILIGMFLIGGFIVLILESWDILMPSYADSFLIAVPLFTFLGVVLGRVLYKRKLDSLKSEKSLKAKMSGFQTALIIKFMLVEAPFVLGVVATISSSNVFYLMISGTLVMYFITLKPTKSKVIKDLDLDSQLILDFKNGLELMK